MTPFEIAQKYVYGEHDALTDNQEIIDMTKDIEQAISEQLILSGVGSSLPDLQECNQAALDYADKKGNPDFFLIKQVFKEGVNWALNKVVKT